MLVQHKVAPGPSGPKTEAEMHLLAPLAERSKHSVSKLLTVVETKLQALEVAAAQLAIMALYSLQAELRAASVTAPTCKEPWSLMPTPEQVRSMSWALIYAKQRAADPLTLEQVAILFGPI